MRNLPDALKASQPSFTNPDYQQSADGIHKFLITCVYTHLLRCMSVLGNVWVMTIALDEFGAYFVGDLLIKLCFIFSLPSSVNLCYMAKVCPFLMDLYKYRFRISEKYINSL